MLKGAFGAILFFLAFAEAGAQSILPTLIKNETRTEEIKTRVDKFVARLQHKRVRQDDQEFVYQIFNETHRKFLKTYKPYSHFSEIFESGSYDCLTATSLLAVILNSFHYNFQVVETNIHVFIIVETQNGKILLETTDPVYGFISDPEKIISKIEQYKNENSASSRINSPLIYKEVDPLKLSGLLLYNEAVVAYNEKDFVNSTLKMLEANLVYNSDRTQNFAITLVTAIMESSYEENLKRNLIRPLIGMINKEVLASR